MNWFKKEVPTVGDLFVDRDWGDTTIVITEVSGNKEKVWHQYTVIDGKVMPVPADTYDMYISTLYHSYKRKHEPC